MIYENCDSDWAEAMAEIANKNRDIYRLRAKNAKLQAALQNFCTWHAGHFEDFASDINAQLLCLANDAVAALAK